MTTNYAGDDTTYPANIPLPDDGEPASSVYLSPPWQKLADRTAWLAKRVVPRRYRSTTTASVFTVPAGVTRLTVRTRAPGGGGGGGPRGNSTNTDSVASLGGGGGGAGELREETIDVTPGEVLTWSKGSAGAGGAGSGSGVGSDGGDGGDATVTCSGSGRVITARGGKGGAFGVRNIDPTDSFAASMGGRSGGASSFDPFLTGDLANKILPIGFVSIEADIANVAYVMLCMGPGAGNSRGYPGSTTGFSTIPAISPRWPATNGTTFSVNGSDGAGDAGKLGGSGGAGGGCTEVAGGAGGAGGAAVAGGSGVAGSAGSAATADTGAGGGGGGAGGTGSSGGAGGNGGAGATGWWEVEYFGPAGSIV